MFYSYIYIESLIPALTARVLQLYAAVPTRVGVFTTVKWKLYNYWPMNKIILGGGGGGGGGGGWGLVASPGRTNYNATGKSLGEMEAG